MTHRQTYHPQHTNHSAIVKYLLPKNTPSTSQVLAVVTLLLVSGTHILLAGITLIGTLKGLALATPLFIIFIPVLVPAALTIGLVVTGFLGSGAFGLIGLSSLSWVLSYFKQASQVMPDQIELSKKRAQEMDVYAGHTTQTKVGQAQDTTTTTGRDTSLEYRKSGWLSPQLGKGNQLLAGIILVSYFVTFAEAHVIATNKETFKSCWLLVLFIIVMAVGGSGSGSALSRVTGNRGRGGRGRDDTRGLGQGRGNGEADPQEENDAEGSDEEQEDDDAGQSDGVLTFGRAQRSICDGDYKKKPQLGQPKLGVVTFINGKNIKEARYKKTIRAIVRNNWEFDTVKEKGRAREAFLNKCIEEFKEYYEYQPEYKVDKIKELAGDAVVRNHLKANLKCYINAWKTDAYNRVKEAHARGDTSAARRTCPPYYLSEPAWEGLCDYWETETFSKLSENVGENDKKSDIKHSSGAKPFDQRYEAKFSLYMMELEKKLEKPLTLLEKFDVSYKKKGKVEEIGRKLKEVVERATEEGNSQDATLSLANQRKRDVELLLEVCPPKKGKFKMFPRHTLTELVGIDEVSKYTTSQSSLVCIPERIPKSAYSIIGKVLTDVTNMVKAIEEIEVTRAKLDEKVQILAARAYPNRDNLASKILWEEYIQIASHMTSPLCERYKKTIIEDTRSDHMEVDEDDNDIHIDDLEYRFPL
ncbi:hypothetical protein AgCh_030431 [Apium graveolens]